MNDDLTPERLGTLVQVFVQIFTATPEDLPIVERARITMLRLPDEAAQEIGHLAAEIAEVAATRPREEQASDPAPPARPNAAPSHGQKANGPAATTGLPHQSPERATSKVAD
ncbi:hypothetical protein [Actinomadura alba]|uniref:Uncharacterized protein n=1 Tax=Actinomadura alba TaxID=406431 RepID=A0ABR7LZT8_9ACTN|nr:hypothetical protein [Actinomadura alba]MBC6470276.1 hypothetical protein [Actinomadura alba]